MKKLLKIQSFLIIALVALTAFTYERGGKFFEISKNLEIFTNIFKELNKEYVDEIEPGPLMKKGIDAMLESLDPYTVYFSESEIEAYRFKSEGNFSDIGVRMVIRADYPVVREIVEKGPAYESELKVGDKILEIDQRSAQSKTIEEINSILQGFSGMDVALKVEDFQSGNIKNITLTRTNTEENNVPHFQIIGDGLAYANLSTFTRNASNNVMKAYKALETQQPIKGYILDLRGNGGGLLSEAVNLSNLFLPKDVLVVTTKSKVIDWDKSYSTRRAPMTTESPLVVLVDGSSASASEIVSGTIQDYDRGVLIGSKTYGKGLVQRTTDVGYNSRLKLTISEYYIPSGRCIQAVRYDDQGNPVEIPLEERSVFKTKNGRAVYDGGGVIPDVSIEEKGNSEWVKKVVNDLIVFDFVNVYLKQHDINVDSVGFRFDRMDDFYSYLSDNEIVIDSKLRRKMLHLLDLSKKEEETEMGKALQEVLREYDQNKLTKLQLEKELLRKEIEKEIIGRSFYKKGKVVHQLTNDPAIEKAVELLNDRKQYNDILKR